MEINVLNFGVSIDRENMKVLDKEPDNSMQCRCTNNCYSGNCYSTCLPPVAQ